MPGTRAQTRNGQWAVYAAFALTVAGIVWQGGVLSARIDSNARAISELKASEIARQITDRDRGDKINAIAVSVARVDGKVDILIGKDGKR